MIDNYIANITCEEYFAEDTADLWAELYEEEEAEASSDK